MRIDHHAYQRGTWVAGFGLLVQVAIGLTMLIFSQVSGDSAFKYASYYILLGSFVWLSLIVIFHQHKLERLEALEEDELAQGRGATESIFDANPDEQRVAARRLALMHKWLMPAASLVIAFLLCLIAFRIVSFLNSLGDAAETGGTEFLYTDQVGWAVAISLGFALISFIFSRFVAGMAKLEVWQNLRGGAAYMVGNALVLIAIGAGLIFRVFDNHEVIVYIVAGLAGYVLLVAAEIVLNFVLNLYRPRIPGEVPRPAFDSRILSLLAAPDSLVRSLNEAVDYQFGFDITSSWGYKLLIRSFAWLVGLGILVLILLNCMVVVEPHQKAVKLSHGRIVGEVHGSGIMWKLPWPLQTAAIHNVTEVKEINLTSRRRHPNHPHLWADELRMDGETHSFLVGSSGLIEELYERDLEPDVLPQAEPLQDLLAEDEQAAEEDLIAALAGGISEEEEPIDETVSRSYALVDAEITLQYRIKDDPEGQGLLDFLKFVPDTELRRRDETYRDRALKRIALREVSQHLSTLTLDEVLALGRERLASDLRGRVQRAFDDSSVRAGVEVVAVNVPLLRPSGGTAREFEELTTSRQVRLTRIAMAERDLATRLAILIGDVNTGRAIVEEIDEWNRLKDEFGFDSEEARQQRDRVESMILATRGAASQIIARAEADHWVELMARRAQALRTQSQVLAYRASPEIYRQREIMQVMTSNLARIRKYVIGIDPSRTNIDFDLKEHSPLVDFSQALPAE